MGMTTTKAQLALVPTGKKVWYNGEKYTVQARSTSNMSLTTAIPLEKYLQKDEEQLFIGGGMIVDVIIPNQDCCMGAAFM